jgi:spore germination protein KB
MKVSANQIFWMIFSMETGMTIMLVIAPTVKFANQDAWISCIIAGIMTILLTFITLKLILLYPNQTFIELCQTILGKWLGKIIVLPYFIMWLSITGIILREYADFVYQALFQQTPMWIIIAIMACAMVYATYGGLVSIGRCSQIIGPFILISFFLLLALAFKDFHWNKLLPIYANSGFLPIIKGSLPITSFLGESIMIVMIVPFMSNTKKAIFSTLSGIALTVFVLLMSFINVITLLGPQLPTKLLYPTYTAVQYISVMEFIQNLDVLAVVIWISTIFIKLCLYLFITSYGAAQWLNLKNWKMLIWIVVVIVCILAILPRNIIQSQIEFPKLWIKFVLPINMVAIPLFLWMIGSIRKKKESSSR